MSLKPELQEIVDEMEFESDEDRTAFEKLMEGKAGAKIAAGYAKNKDYTTKTQALATARAELEKQQQEFNEGQEYLTGQMSTYKTDVEKRLNDALAQAAASRTYGAALESKLQALAAQYGEDPTTLLADVKEMRAKEPETKKAEFNDDEFNKRYLQRDEFTRVANSFGAYPTQLRDFERDYEREFGKPYEGSLHELVTSASQEVEALRARGKQVDLFSHIRTKLDFAGQAQRNQEAAKTKATEEQEAWKTQTREEIEREVRSQVLADNPTAYKTSWEKPEAWRNELAASKRGNQIPQKTPQDEHKNRVNLHKIFEENAAKANAA